MSERQEWLPTLDGKRTTNSDVIHLLVGMFKYRGKGINIVFGEPLPPKPAPPPRPAPKNIAAEALKVKDFLAQDPERSYLHASRNFKVTRARISQLMKIVKTLPADFIEQIGHTDDHALLRRFSGVNLLKIAKMDTMSARQKHIHLTSSNSLPKP